MTSAMLELSGIDCFHGQAQALFAVSLTVGTGEAVALIGRNGAGKSTLLRTVAGLIRPAAGTIRFDGRDIAGWPPHKVARQGIGWVPEDRRVFPDLTVQENLEVGRRPARTGLSPWTEDRLFALFPPLARLRDHRAGTLSGGEAQMLAIARTLIGNPLLLLLDEPAEGLAPVVVAETAAAIAAIKREGVAILLSDQTSTFADGLIDRVHPIVRGEVGPGRHP